MFRVPVPSESVALSVFLLSSFSDGRRAINLSHSAFHSPVKAHLILHFLFSLLSFYLSQLEIMDHLQAHVLEVIGSVRSVKCSIIKQLS